MKKYSASKGVLFLVTVLLAVGSAKAVNVVGGPGLESTTKIAVQGVVVDQ